MATQLLTTRCGISRAAKTFVSKFFPPTQREFRKWALPRHAVLFTRNVKLNFARVRYIISLSDRRRAIIVHKRSLFIASA